MPTLLGAGPIDSRSRSSTGRIRLRGSRRPPFIASTSVRKAWRPISYIGVATVVRLRCVKSANGVPSKLASDTSPGTLTPASSRNRSTPTAEVSFDATTAVGLRRFAFHRRWHAA